MIKELLKYIYYFFYDYLNILKKLRKGSNFIIILPRFISILIKKVYIFDRINKNIFSQSIRNKYDLLTVFEIFLDEEYNLKKLKRWNEILSNYNSIISNNLSPLIFDCGSNIGSSSNYFYKIFNSSCIVMIEPDKNNLDYSKINTTSINKKLFNNAISFENKIVNFDNLRNDNRSFKIAEEGKIKVNTITVDEIIRDMGDKFKPFLIKIDIEGFEEDLFKRNIKWLDLFDIVIIELHDWMLPKKSNSENFLNAISSSNSLGTKRDIIISGENLICLKV